MVCPVLGCAAAFFFFVVCVLSIVSTSMPDWARIPDEAGMGLWSTCVRPGPGLGYDCGPSANFFTGGCLALLNVVRAFSIMTIIFSCFTFVLCYLLAACVRAAAPCAFICGTLTAMFSVVPWAVWLGFENQCVFPLIGFPLPANLTHGSGWSLAVSACPIAYVGLFIMLCWCLACYRSCGARAGGRGGAAPCCAIPIPVPCCPPSPCCCLPCPPSPGGCCGTLCPSPCCMPAPCPCSPCLPPCPCPCTTPCLPLAAALPPPVGEPVSPRTRCLSPALGAGGSPYSSSGLMTF